MKEYFARVTVSFFDGGSISDTYTIEAKNEVEARHYAIDTAFMLECTDRNGIINIDWIYEK